MSIIQAITRAQKLTDQTERTHVVLEEQFQRHKPSYHVKDGLDWFRITENSPQWAARYRVVYP